MACVLLDRALAAELTAPPVVAADITVDDVLGVFTGTGLLNDSTGVEYLHFLVSFLINTPCVTSNVKLRRVE